MKQLLFVLMVALLSTLPLSAQTIYDFKMDDIDGKPVSLSQYKGKVVMIVNVAS